MPPKIPEFEPSQKPWPSYFIVRTKAGHIVPLVAVDELPPSLNIVGVPRALDLTEATGMINLGLQKHSDAFYQVIRSDFGGKLKEKETESEKRKVVESGLRGAGKEKEKEKAVENTSSMKPPSLVPQPSLSITIPSKTSRLPPDAPGTPAENPTSMSYLTVPPRHASTNPSPDYPSGLPRSISPSHQQTCRHWCAHGICKWGPRCYYRHIMPMNCPGLQEVGLRDWPLWYRRENPDLFVSDMVAGGGTGGVGNPATKGNGRERVDIVVGGTGEFVRRYGVRERVGGSRRASARRVGARDRGGSRIEERVLRVEKEEDQGESVICRLREPVSRDRERECDIQPLMTGPVGKGGGQVKTPLVGVGRRRDTKRVLDDIVAKGEVLRWEDDTDSDVSSCSTVVAELLGYEEARGKGRSEVAEGELIDVSVSGKTMVDLGE